MLPEYLDEFMWREHAGENKFKAICREISRFKVFISVTLISNKMCFVFSVVKQSLKQGSRITYIGLVVVVGVGGGVV